MKNSTWGEVGNRGSRILQRQRVTAGVALLCLALNAGAWEPAGWSWWSGSYAIEHESGDTYWLNLNDPQWTYGLAPANGWQRLSSSALVAGWSWWSWPYAYDVDVGAWFYVNEQDTQWCVNLESGAWSKLGAPATEPVLPSAMVEIPAGTFQMGNALSATGDGNAYNEVPVHAVTLGAFAMDRYEITKGAWDAVRAWGLTNGYTDLPAGAGQASDHPVQMINWFAALKWCNARSQMEGRPACYTVSNLVYRTGQNDADCDWTAEGYRLPTEAEREKAAQGGTEGTRFPWTDTDTVQHARANYQSSALFSYDTSATRGYHPDYTTGAQPHTSPVGSFAANGYGLHDMAGNVWELCWDWYESGYYNYSTDTNPRGPAGGSDRVIRGGSWANYADNCRVSDRYIVNPYSPINNVGFRTVLPRAP